MSEIDIRHATLQDLPALTEIYNHYVVNTPITFDIETWTSETRLPWFQQFKPATPHQLMVLTVDGELRGYASSSPLRPKRAYETSIESTIYLHPDAGGRGLGKQLYGALFESLINLDLHRCYGVITMPNDASVALHRHFGFYDVGRLNEVGRKFGRYWDTLWMEKVL